MGTSKDRRQQHREGVRRSRHNDVIKGRRNWVIPAGELVSADQGRGVSMVDGRRHMYDMDRGMGIKGSNLVRVVRPTVPLLEELGRIAESYMIIFHLSP